MRFAHILISAMAGSCLLAAAARAQAGAETPANAISPRLLEQLRGGEPPSAPPTSLLSANSLGAKLLDQLNGPKNASNFVLSPFSLDSALGMLALAANGKTLTALHAVRTEKGSAEDIEQDYQLQRALAGASTPDVTLRTANSMWLKPGATPQPKFVGLMLGIFAAPVRNVDFAKPATVETVNAWVKTNTQNVIPQVVDSLDAGTEFLLINTTYFKGKWATQFDAAVTKAAPFTRLDGSMHDVPMMNATLKVDYAAQDDWQAVRLPYVGERFEMRILTAKDAAGSLNLKTKLGAYGTLQALAKAPYEIRDVKVGLPRFRADSGADLTPALRQLGLRDAFTKGAAYPGLTNGKSQVVPSVFQRAVVEVTEEGTEAAAATVVGTPRDAGAPAPVAFMLDHPFYFGIFDNETGAVLFMGYVADPAT